MNRLYCNHVTGGLCGTCADAAKRGLLSGEQMAWSAGWDAGATYISDAAQCEGWLSPVEARGLRAEVAHLRELLRRVEWPHRGEYGHFGRCAICGADEENDHAHGCDLAAAVKGE